MCTTDVHMLGKKSYRDINIVNMREKQRERINRASLTRKFIYNNVMKIQSMSKNIKRKKYNESIEIPWWRQNVIDTRNKDNSHIT